MKTIRLPGVRERRRAAVDHNLTVALTNEQLTRQRVEECEKAIAALAEVLARGFWGRLTWLVRGR